MDCAGSSAPHHDAKPDRCTEDIRTSSIAIDRTTAKGARDAAIILLGFASALRRAELAALTVGDVEFKPGGILINVSRSKSDQDGEGQRVAVVHGQHAATDPVGALNAWLDCAGGRPAAVHQPATTNRHPRPHLRAGDRHRPTQPRPRRGVRRRRFPPHSLRAGHATSAAAAGVTLDRIAARTRHKRLSTSSSATSAPPKPPSTPPAATSDYETTERPASSAQRVLLRPSAWSPLRRFSDCLRPAWQAPKRCSGLSDVVQSMQVRCAQGSE